MSINDENNQLKLQLTEVFDLVRENEKKLKRFESIEYKLLEADSFEKLLNILFLDYPSLFKVDFTSLILSDTKLKFSHFLTSVIKQNDFNRVQLLSLPGEVEKLERYGHKICFGEYEAEKHDWLNNIPTEQTISSIGVLPLIRYNQLIGIFCCFSSQPNRFDSSSGNIFLERLGKIISICFESVLNREELTLITYTDPLTQTRNRRYFDQLLSHEVKRSNRSLSSLSCVLIDIDHFKLVNDNYGHQIGDEVLIQVVKRINGVLRTHEILARFGGEEFVILLVQTANKAAILAAQRIIDIIHNSPFELSDGQVLKVTISAGVSTFTSRNDKRDCKLVQEKLIEGADKALYVAKDSGRNQVQSSGEVILE
ncbi:MAG: GGDEF domain-containing protein [Gammaproteobacteria bacterium]|nr:GGDEF domain-containing protein [Gammaproteobacteria bacterium]